MYLTCFIIGFAAYLGVYAVVSRICDCIERVAIAKNMCRGVNENGDAKEIFDGE